MTRLIVLIVLTLIAVGVAFALQRRRPDPPSAPSYKAPTQVDRSDFVGSDVGTLIAVFTSATCASCAVALETARSVAAAREGLVVQDIEVNRDSRLHQRYTIDGVPTTLVVDDEGIVVASFFVPTDVPELAETLP